MEEHRNDDLVRRLVEASELHGDFVLSSGTRSTVYFDKFRFLTRPDLLDELAREVVRLLPPGTDHLAAPEGAATLLVAAVSLRTGLPLAVVRKEAKSYGTMEQLEGYAPAGAHAVLLEDVSTTGHQVRAAADGPGVRGGRGHPDRARDRPRRRRPPAGGGLRRRRRRGPPPGGSIESTSPRLTLTTFRSPNDATISIVP